MSETVAHASLNEALAAIMAEVSYIEKDATNTFHKYRYASEETIKKTLRAALVKHGVLFKLETSAPATHILSERKDDKESWVSVVTLQCRYTFTHVTSGETDSGEFVGSGSGRDDKGFYAAVTGAIKYALTSRFLIPTGDDPEHDRNEAPADAPRPQTAPSRPVQSQGRPQAQGSAAPASTGKDGGFKPTRPVLCPTCGGTTVFPSSKVPGGFYCAQSNKYQGCGASWDAAAWVKAKRELAASAPSSNEPPPPDDLDFLGEGV